MWSIKQGVKRLLTGEGEEESGLRFSVDDIPCISDPGRIAVRGWVLDPEKSPVSLELRMEGRLLRRYRPQVARPDVAQAYSDNRFSFFSGFVIPFEMQLLARIPTGKLQLFACSTSLSQLLWEWEGVAKEVLEQSYLADCSILSSVDEYRRDNPEIDYDPHWLSVGEVEAFFHPTDVYRDYAPADLVEIQKGAGADFHLVIEYSNSTTRLISQIQELSTQLNSDMGGLGVIASLSVFVDNEGDVGIVESAIRAFPVHNTSVIIKEQFAGWESLAGTSSQSTDQQLVIYASGGALLHSANLKQIVEVFCSCYGSHLIAPVPLGKHTGLSGPQGVSSRDLKDESISLYLNSTSCPPVWISTISFLKSLEPERRGLDGRPGLFLPPHSDAFTYHLDLGNPVITTLNSEFDADRDAIFLARKAYAEIGSNLLSETRGSETVFIVLSPALMEASQCSEHAAQILALADGIQLAGNKVVMVLDDEDADEHSPARMFGTFTPLPLSSFPASADWGKDSSIIASDHRSLRAASVLRYLTGGVVAQVFAAQGKHDGSIPADERRVAEWARRADYTAIFLHEEVREESADSASGLLVPISPALQVDVTACAGKGERSGIVLNFAGRQLSEEGVKLAIAVIEQLQSEFEGEQISLVSDSTLSEALRERSVADLWRRCLELSDHCLSCPDDTERQELFCEARVFLDLFPSFAVNLFAGEAARCGMRVIVSPSSGLHYSVAEGGIDAERSTVALLTPDNVIARINTAPGELNGVISRESAGCAFGKREAEKLLRDIRAGERDLLEQIREERDQRRGVSVIVPIYCALDSVQMCLASLKTHCPEDYQILLVNDASDKGTTAWLRSFVEKNTRFHLIDLPENVGFIGACNAGLHAAEANNDIILVNSDVVVTSSSFELVQDAAYSDVRAGIASPLSTGSPHFQVELNDGDTLESAAERIEKLQAPVYPTAITPEGQFLFIRRHVIDRFGFLDHVYGRGFFEESDLCMRAFLNGVGTVCADNALIFHRRAASFGGDVKNVQLEKNAPIFFGRWRRYWEKAYERFAATDVIDTVIRNYRSCGPTLKRPSRPFDLEREFERFEKLASDRTPALHGQRVLNQAEVVFVLPSIIVGGGTLSVLQHVNELIKQGVEARVVSLQEPELGDYPLLTAPIVVSPEQLFELDWSNQSVIATYWFTSYLVKGLVARYKNLKGFYYVQDYEPWFYPRSERFTTVQQVERSYELGLQCVVKTEFLQTKLREEHGVEATLITPGIQSGVFYPGAQDDRLGPPILTALLRSRTPRRGGKELLEMLKIVTSRVPELQVRLFGDTEGVSEELQGRVELLGSLSQSKVGELYRKSDILVDLSHWHGFGRMGIEAMACGAVPVLSRSGGVDRYARNKENALLCDVGDYRTAAERVINLACDRELRLKLRSTGLSSVTTFNEAAATQDWMILLGISDEKVVGLSGKKTARLNGSGTPKEAVRVLETGS